MKLSFRTMDGTLLDANFEASDFVYDVAHQLATQKSQQVSVRLTSQGTLLPPGCRLEECGLKEEDLIDVVFVAWMPPAKVANSLHEVLPRRMPDDLDVGGVTVLDASGIFVRSASRREEIAQELTSKMRPSLMVLDVRQCAFSPLSLLAIFQCLPEALEELWASRNHFDAEVLGCLKQKSLRLKVLDIGYNECNDLRQLPELLTEQMEQLILGDLEKLKAPTFEAALAKCPRLKSLEIHFNNRLGKSYLAIAQCSELRKLLAQYVHFSEEALQQILESCQQLEHVVLKGINDLSTVQRLKKLNLKVLQASLTPNHQILAEISTVQSDTLMIGIDFLEALEEHKLEDLSSTVEALKMSPATCIAWSAEAVNIAVLQAIGPRLCEVSGACNNTSDSVLSDLAQIPASCANLISLSVNYYEQIDPKDLVKVAAACPMLRDLHLNADDCDFQRAFIDEGVLALGQHCHMLQHLDMYDRVMADPAITLMKACEGWPLLRYLCLANCTRGDWESVSKIHELPAVLAGNCGKLETVVIYDDKMNRLFDTEFESRFALYGPSLL